MQAKPDNAPLEKAVLLLRPDLTLQVSAGTQALEVHLAADMAYGLALALIANIADLAPWQSHEDAQIYSDAHDLAFSALRLAARASTSKSIDKDIRALLAVSLPGAMAQLEILQAELTATATATESHGTTQAH